MELIARTGAGLRRVSLVYPVTARVTGAGCGNWNVFLGLAAGWRRHERSPGVGPGQYVGRVGRRASFASIALAMEYDLSDNAWALSCSYTDGAGSVSPSAQVSM